MSLTVPILLSRSPGDRILLGIFSPIIGAMTGGLAYAAHTFAGQQKSDPVLRIGAYLVSDFTFTFFSFSLPIIIWALFAPVWLERLLAGRARRVLLTVCFLVTGAAIGMLYFAT